MPGVRALRKVGLGREATAGTKVTATTIWRGTGGMPNDTREVTFPEENIGYISGTTRNYIARIAGEMALDETPATFEQFPHILEAGVQTVTPTTDTGSGYIYTYNFPTTAQNTIKTYSIEAGDDQQIESAAYGFVTDFTLSGVSGEAWQVGSTWQVRQWEPDTWSSSATAPVIEEMLFSKTKLYIGATTDTLGSTDTLKSNTLLAATLNATTGVIPVFTAEGQLYFSFTKATMPEVTLELTLEHDATSVAERAFFRAGTPRQILLVTTGSALTSAGAYATKTMKILLSGVYETFPPLEDQDGNDIYTITFRARYNATTGQFATITIVNELATLP